MPTDDELLPGLEPMAAADAADDLAELVEAMRRVHQRTAHLLVRDGRKAVTDAMKVLEGAAVLAAIARDRRAQEESTLPGLTPAIEAGHGWISDMAQLRETLTTGEAPCPA